MAIALGTQKQEGTLSLARGNKPTYSTERTDDLATKYSISLGDQSPGEDVVRAGLVQGNTDRMAQLLAQRKQVDNANVQNEVIQSIADQTNGVPSELDMEVVRGLSQSQMASPDLNSILETEFSKKVTNLSASLINQDTGVLDDAMREDPNAALEVVDRVENNASRNFIASNLSNELSQKFGQQNLLVQGQAWLQQMIPFRSWYEMNTFVKGAPFISLIPGDSIEGQIAYLYTLPPDQFKKELQAGIKSATDFGNYLDAMTFLEAVQSFSETDAVYNNVFAGLDIVTAPGVGLLGKGLRGTSRVVSNSARDLLGSAAQLNLGKKAVEASFTDALRDGKLPSFNIRKVTDAENTVPSIFRPTEAFTNGTVKSVDGAALTRLQRAAEARGGKAIEIISGINRVERLAPEELAVAYSEAEKTLEETFTHQNHSVINVSRNAAEDNIGNVYSVTVSLGQKNGNAFRSEKAANKFAEFVALKTDDYTVEPLGSGFVVNVSRNVDETSGGVRNLTIATNSQTPDTFDRRFLGYIYGADRKLSSSQTSARGVAVFGSEHMSQLMGEFTKPFNALKKGELKGLEDFLVSSRDYVDPKTNIRGISYKTVNEFEDAFRARMGTNPSYQQIDAYSAFKQAYDMDWLIRDLDVFKQKAIMGVEQIGLKFGDSTINFEGKVVTSLPRGSKQPFSIGVVNDGKFIGRSKGSKYPTFRSNQMSKENWDLIDEYIADGYQIVQAYEGRVELGGVYSNFILTRDAKRNRVGMINLNYRDGSRVIQKYPHYVKQGNLQVTDGQARYLGDVSAANARSAADGESIAERMNTARLMIKNGDINAERYIKDNLPMYDFDHLSKLFADGTFNVNTPFTSVRSGSRTIDNFDMVGALRKEGVPINNLITDDEFDLSRQVNGRFLGERDSVSMSTYKVENNTVLKVDTDPLMSPFDTLRTSMSDMIDTHVVHDYRIKSSWDYTKEFGDLLDGTESDFMTNGLSFIYEPKYRSGVDPNRVRIAENVRKSILGLFNNKTLVERQVDMYKEKMTNSLRGLLGDDVGEWVADSAIHTSTNADKWMRSAAFHSKMGFFNVKQLFLQASSAVNIVSITPTHGSRGARVLAPLMQALYAPNEKILARFAEKQSISGFTKDEFLELVSSYKKSGFGHVGNDVAYLDDLMPPKLIKGAWSSVLDTGTNFFKAGERISRTMAYAAAYSERKAMLKGGVLRRADEAWILQRSKDLTGNMTRDSNAQWQKGWGAVATQFMGFQMRLMEQMISKKLTFAEKGRLFAGMSIMYGVPVAEGMTFGVVPIRDWLRDKMTAEGFEYDNTIMEPFVDGFASTILEQFSGMDLNFSERYGPGGLTTFYDFLKGDSNLSEILLGASGGVIADTIKDANPILQGMIASFDFNDNTVYPITVSDLIEPLRNISTINNAIKLWEGVNLGQWVSQNENILTDVSVQEAIVSSIFGLDPERVSDTFSQIDAVNQVKDYQASVRKDQIIDVRRAISALRENDPESAKVFFSRVKAMGIRAGFTIRQMAQMYDEATDKEPLDESVMQSYKQYVLDLKPKME